MENVKRIVAMLLCFAMCMSMLPAEAFAVGIDETTGLEETVCFDHDHDYGENEEIAFTDESGDPADDQDQGENEESASDDEGTESEEGSTASEQSTEAEETVSEDEVGETEAAFMASCSHSYTYTYSAAGHTQHTKKGTCSKCGGTTSTKENHTWSGSQCSHCGCYKPITANGTYDVIAADGIQLYSESNSSSTKVKVVSKGTSITVTSVAATSSGYYWGKVTKVGTATQSTSAWVCMKSSELGTHSHSYSYSYEVDGHTQHIKKGSCTKCGAATSATESHSWSGSRCSSCGCYKPITSNGTYDVIASGGVQLYSENNSGSSKVKVVPQGSSITVTNVAVTGSRYYWGKVTKVGTATQSASAWVCMKSSELGTHSHSYSYSYEVDGHTQHIKKGSCTKCGVATSATESHSWSGSRCSSCGCYKPVTSDGTYDVIASGGVQLFSENNSGSSKVKVVPKGANITVANVGLTSTRYYWGKVTKVGTATQSASAWVCMKGSDLQPHSHSFTNSYTKKSDTQHYLVSTCACGEQVSTEEGHSWSGGTCSLCGKTDFVHTAGDYVTYRESEALRVDTYENSDSPRSVPKGTYIHISDIVTNKYGNYWGKVGSIDGEVPSTTLYAYMGNLEAHSHTIEKQYKNINNVEHDATENCSSCNYTKKTRTGHNWSGGKCSLCGGWKAYETDGDYIVINEEGVKLYSERITSGTSQELKPLKKGTFVQVKDVRLNGAKNYWGEVVKIGNETPGQPMYIYMGSGQVQPHTHSWSVTYTTPRDAWHIEQKSCGDCGYIEQEAKKDHTFANHACKYCGHPEVPDTKGDYVTYRESEALRVDTYENSASPRSLPKGTYIHISEKITNQYGNYWGKVGSIDGEVPSTTLYAYMGNLKAHTHSIGTKYKNINNVEHDATETCSGCNYTKKTRTGHSWSGGKCSLCGGWKAYETDGDYIVINEEGVKLYSERITSGTSQELDPLKKGTFVQVKDVRLNGAKNYWGEVVKIGNETPGQPMYIYMGSGQVQPHTHSWAATYATPRDAWHIEQKSCTGCGYIEQQAKKDHTFVNRACKYCGHAEVPSVPGSYVPYRASEPLREAPNEKAKELDRAEKGNYLEITEAPANQYGNYWGKVVTVGSRKLAQPLYVYMGNVAAHTHSLAVDHVQGNNEIHKTVSTCACGFTETVKEAHDYKNNTCSLCGALEPYKSKGTYLIINENGVWTYTQRLSSGSSSQVVRLPKNSFIEVVDVKCNDAGYYWGEVVSVDGKPAAQKMFIYMGRGQVMPHQHSMNITYSTKSDTQHYKNMICPGCGFTQTEATVEGHAFNGGEKCELCGKEKVSDTAGTYVTVRTLETLRLDPYEAADKAEEKLPAGTCIEVETPIPNKYGNLWAVVKSIDGKKPAVSPTYAYIGNLKPHTHSLGKTYKGINNVSHDVTEACSGCNLSKTERLPHTSGDVCELCTAWAAYKTDGDYITIKDDVPVYSRNITSPKDSRVLDSLPKNTYVCVEDVGLNTADNYWGRVKRVGNKAVSVEMYIYMGRGQLQPHGHSMATTYSSKSDLQHAVNNSCTVCGYTDTKPTAEDHDFDTAGVCRQCKTAEVAHSGSLYVTVRESESLRADRYSDSQEVDNRPKGTALTVSDIRTNKYGNWWGRVVEINGEPVTTTCYTYLGNLQPHVHSKLQTVESVNNLTHKIVTACEGCNVKQEVRQAHDFDGNGVCKVCNAWQVYKSGGGYVTVAEAGTPLYSQRLSDKSKGSKELKTLHVGTYIKVEDVKYNDAGYYWGKVTQIGNCTEKQAMYVYMGRGQLLAHNSGDHSYSASYESVNNQKHKADKVCTVCSYTQTAEEAHDFGTGEHNACTNCGAWKPNTTGGGYLTVKDGVILYSKNSSDTKKKSKELKTLPKGTYLEVVEVDPNPAGNYWGKVTKIDNDPAGKTVMYVYMGTGSLEAHTHRLAEDLISTSDTQHTYGSRCQDCAYIVKKSPEAHAFDSDSRCKVCGKEEVCHETGSYVTVRTTESLRADRVADSEEVRNVPAGTLIEVSGITPNKYGNWWGKVSKISGESVGRKTMYTYLGNLEFHPSHTLAPFWKSENDAQHKIGEKCTKCDYENFTSMEAHTYGTDGLCAKCAKSQVSMEGGNYVTFRESEPLRSSANRDAKSLKNVSAGTRLYISSAKENGYNNWWGIVSKIDGKNTDSKKTMYVYMGNVQRHESHDMQPFCDRKSDTQHISGLRCTGCNLTEDTRQNDHRMDSNGHCLDCGAEEIIHRQGGYLVRTAGNLKKGRGQDTGDVQWAAVGAYLEVTDITANEFGNWWGKVTSINGAKPKKTSAFVYLGNLVPHEHKYVESYVAKNQTEHTITAECTECSYLVTVDEKHDVTTNGKCSVCQAEVPRSTSKGDYVTFRTVTLYQDNKLTKPAGIHVAKGYLIKTSGGKPVKNADGEEIYVGKVEQYGNVPSGKDSLYVKMSDITPHEDHSYTEFFWSKCDAYHYESHACSVVGCTATRKGEEKSHDPGEKCVCGKTPVPQTDGVYRVRSGSDLDLYSKDNSDSKTAGTAEAGSIIVVEQVDLTPSTGNYWGKVIWFNGKMAEKTAYVYMGSLVPYTGSASVTVSGSDQKYHYLRDGSEIFPEKHDFRDAVCGSCGMVENAPVTGLYLVRENCRIYSKPVKNIIVVTTKSYQAGSVLQIKSIENIRGVWYGIVSTCDGAKVKGTPYVQLAGLTYHGKHVAGSEYWVQLNDKQHTYDVNCPVCGTNKKVNADHVFNDQGVCTFCAQVQPFTTKGDCYIVVKQANVYKSNVESSAILETLPKGTVLKVDTVKEKNGIYMGSGIQVMEDGKQIKHKGYIRMSRTWLAEHAHSWSQEKLVNSSQTEHSFVRTCTVCGLEDEKRIVDHNYLACGVCGTKSVRIGDYTVKDHTATVYKDTSGKTVHTRLDEGVFVQITKIVPDNGIYWGKVFRIGEKEIKDNAYIPMHALKTHTHKWNYVLNGAEDNYHTFRANCTSCGLTEQKADYHNFSLGACTVCGNAVVQSSTGVYVAAEELVVYKYPRRGSAKVSKNPSVSKGTHVYIQEVKPETAMIQTGGDGSFYGEILWGRIYAAGEAEYPKDAWVRMSSLQDDGFHTTVSYKTASDQNHHVTFGCENHNCGLKGSISLNHEFDSAGTCTLCGFVTVQNKPYFTTRSNCKTYNLLSNGMESYSRTIVAAGTPVEVLKVQLFKGEMYCYIRQEYGSQAWIAQSDLTDHIHMAAGLYAVVDDKYHQSSGWKGSVCMTCGAEIPELNTASAKSEHSYEAGFCKLCGMQEIPTATGKYYAPYDGYFAYKNTSEVSRRGTTYHAGEAIQIVKAPITANGIIWGQVKNTNEYVIMKTLSKTPVKQTEAMLLTDREVIDWCVNFDGAHPFYTYSYYSDMLNSLGPGDILLMAINSRAGGLTDQFITWIKEAFGETMANQYYEGQILAMLTALEEEADYSVSFAYKSDVKNVIKLSSLLTKAEEIYQEKPEADNLEKVNQLKADLDAANKKLTESDLAATKKLKANLKAAGKILDYGEIGLEAVTYIFMDYGRMQGIIETARAIQKETTSDPDLDKAFDDVIRRYEIKYFDAAAKLIEAIVTELNDHYEWTDNADKWAAAQAASLIKKFTGFDAAAGWSDFGFVYSAANFTVDVIMQYSGGKQYAKSTLQFMSQISLMRASLDAYSAAVKRIQDGDHSANAVAAVRRQFAACKVSMVELYDTMLGMSNYVFDIGEDEELLNYLQYEKNKLESICMVNDLNKLVKGISLEEYRRTH